VRKILSACGGPSRCKKCLRWNESVYKAIDSLAKRIKKSHDVADTSYSNTDLQP
jgi:hypothetical protein